MSKILNKIQLIKSDNKDI